MGKAQTAAGQQPEPAQGACRHAPASPLRHPDRDNPEQLKTFLASFDPTFLGATGTPRQLADVRKAYGITVSDKIFVETMPKSSYFFDHSSFVYLIDRSGQLRAMMPFGVSADDIEHDVKALLSR